MTIADIEHDREVADRFLESATPGHPIGCMTYRDPETGESLVRCGWRCGR